MNRVLAALLATALALAAQSAPTSPPAKAADEAPVQLSVFEVTAENDRGYAASTATSGTRTNEKLENLPNAISVMTADLLADLGALNFLDAVDFAVGAGGTVNVGTKRPTFGRTSTSAATRWDSWGGRRVSLDDQRTLVPRKVAYRRKFGRVTWTGQINVQNVFDRVSYQGLNYRNNRLTDPRQFVFTNTFTF